MKRNTICRGVMILMTTVFLNGCTVTKKEVSFTYIVETGDAVKITLDKMNGYSIIPEDPFTITKDDRKIMTGTFLSQDEYDYYYGVMNDYPENIEIIDIGEKDGNDYYFYKVDEEVGIEYDYLVKVGDSSTSIIMGCPGTEEDASSCFDALIFSVEE